MTSPRRTLARLLKGPVGGMLLCVLIAGFLGGVAVAHPGGNKNDASSQTSPSSDPSEAPQAPEQDQQSTAPDAGRSNSATPSHPAADCQAQPAAVPGPPPAPFRVACPNVRDAAVGAPFPRSEDAPPALVQERPRPDRLRIERVRRVAGPQLEHRDRRTQEDLGPPRRRDPGLREPRRRRG